MEMKTNQVMIRQMGLNPYCNGRYSWSLLDDIEKGRGTVLILIVMEDTHGELMARFMPTQFGLNPYYNGRYSWSPR